MIIKTFSNILPFVIVKNLSLSTFCLYLSKDSLFLLYVKNLKFPPSVIVKSCHIFCWNCDRQKLPKFYDCFTFLCWKPEHPKCFPIVVNCLKYPEDHFVFVIVKTPVYLSNNYPLVCVLVKTQPLCVILNFLLFSSSSPLNFSSKAFLYCVSFIILCLWSSINCSTSVKPCVFAKSSLWTSKSSHCEIVFLIQIL